MAPIIRKTEIQEGDLIRRITEYTVVDGPDPRPGAMSTYELVNRPVKLPTEDGWYESSSFPLSQGCNPYQFKNGSWFAHSLRITDKEAASYAPYSPLRPEAAVAAEILQEVRALFGPNATLLTDVDRIAKKFGVQK